jgi:hypothetical protein
MKSFGTKIEKIPRYITSSGEIFFVNNPFDQVGLGEENVRRR